MSPPLLLAVEDDPAALADVERELSGRYGGDYEVVCTPSPDDALDRLSRAASEAEEVALVLAAQWLPGTTGSELLDRVWSLHPHAKRGLLVPWRAWDDAPTAEAIFDAIALGRIDYYLLKPAEPPDEVFHQAISSFLLEWSKARRIAPHTIRIVAEQWSGRAYELRSTLQRCAIPHDFCLTDSAAGRKLLAEADRESELPLVFLPNGHVLSNPTNAELGGWTGASTRHGDESFDVVILGAGPAGLSAAVYGASEGLDVLVVDEGGIGGQATSSSMIRNYLGFPRGVSGSRLAEQAYQQAWVFGASFALLQVARSLEPAGEGFAVTLAEGQRVTARAVIVAIGAAHRRLGVPALEELNGAGVFYGGPASEAHAMSGKRAYVVGGANSAGQAALHLANYADLVTLVVRAESLDAGMSHYLIQEIGATPNIAVRTRNEIVGGAGDGHLERLVLRDSETGGEQTVPADGLFVLIGAEPRTAWLPAAISRDPGGFVLTGGDLAADGGWPLERPPLLLETSMPGVLAAGDVRHGSVKRVASAVGEGSIAIQLVHGLLESHAPERERVPGS